LLNGSSDVFNHPITVGDAAVTVNGQNYLRFFLDINESDTASDRYLAMTELRIFTGGAPNQTTLDVTDPTTLGTLRYDMGAGNGVLLDYDIGEGSGKADMVLLIPLYAGAVLTDNLYLYSSFGRATTGITCTGSGGVSGGAAGCVVAGGNYFNSDGFEEWAVLQGEVSIVPEPSTYALYALGATMLFVSGWWQRRRRALLSPMA
jgi:hypothetical protein